MENKDKDIKIQRVTLNRMTIDDNKYHSQQKSGNTQRKSANARRRRTKRSAPKWALAAICAAAAVVLIAALYFFVFMNQGLAASAATATPSATVTPDPTPSPSPAPTPSPTPVPTATPEPTPSTMWGAKFPGKFTDGEIIKNDSSVSPTISELSPRFKNCTIEVVGYYKSAHVNVTVNKVQENGVVYFVSDIYTTDLKYFTAPFSDGKYGKGDRKFVYDIAKDNNAVIAINGDFYTENDGPVLRDGVLYRNEVKLDILVMFKDGTMKTYTKDEYDKDTIESMKNDVWQIWTFGPQLLQDGATMTKFNLAKPIGGANPRTAIGYYEPGHYVFVSVDGRQPGYSKGLSMTELSQLMYDLGCKTAFNLDGGGSAQMAFEGEEINQAYKVSTYRMDRDALCIVDEPAPEETAVPTESN